MKKILAGVLTASLCLTLLVVGASTASAQVIPGCFPGFTYSTQNGQVCTSTSTDLGCTPGNTYSTVTGAVCTQSTTPTVPGFPNTGAEPLVSLIVLSGLALAFMAGTALALRKIA